MLLNIRSICHDDLWRNKSYVSALFWFLDECFAVCVGKKKQHNNGG